MQILFLIKLKSHILFLTLALSAAACAPTITESPRIETGVETSAPGGWVGYCIRVPTDEACND